MTKIKDRNIIHCSPESSNYLKPGTIALLRTWTNPADKIFTNDNKRPAGELKNGVLYLKMEK